MTLGDQRPAVSPSTASAASAAASRALAPVEQRRLGAGRAAGAEQRDRRVAAARARPPRRRRRRRRACGRTRRNAVRAPAGSGGTRSRSALARLERGAVATLVATATSARRARAEREPGSCARGSAWTTEPPTVPRERVAAWPTWRTAWASSGQCSRDQRRALERRLADGRADVQRRRRCGGSRRGRRPVDVDEPGRAARAQVQQRQQALAAGQHAGALGVERLERLRRPTARRRTRTARASSSTRRSPRTKRPNAGGVERVAQGRRRDVAVGAPPVPSSVDGHATGRPYTRCRSPCRCRRRPPRARSCRASSRRRADSVEGARGSLQRPPDLLGRERRVETRPPSASASALATAGGRADRRRPRPMPLTPSGFSGDGDSTNAVANSGISAAVSSV